MTETTSPRPISARDRGQALPIILVFVIVFGAVIAALLNSVDSGLRLVTQLRTQRSTLYSAASATDIAIEYIRADTTRATQVGGSCPTVTIPNSSSMAAATVTCTVVASSANVSRQIQFTASVDGATRIKSEVLIHDDTLVSGSPKVDILSWNYVR